MINNTVLPFGVYSLDGYESLFKNNWNAMRHLQDKQQLIMSSQGKDK